MFTKNKILLLFIVFTFFFLRIYLLGFDITNNDSQRWLNRSESFLQALKDSKFEDTNQKYHPGVTLMIANSVTRQIFYLFQYNFLDYKLDLTSQKFFPYVNLISKLVIVLILFGILLFQFYLIYKIWGSKIALTYFFLISIEPYFIGINRWFHLTSLEVLFSFTSILTLIYWHYSGIKKYFILSSIFLALGVLTKVTSLVIGIVVLLILIQNYLKTRDIKIFIYFGLIYSATIFLLFPALWVVPIETSMYILNSIFNAVEEDVRAGQLNSNINVFYYIIILIFKLSPITLIIFLISFTQIKLLLKERFAWVLYTTLLVYFAILSFSDQKIDRYSLVFFQPILLLCAIFISKLNLSIQKLIFVLYTTSLILFYFWYFPQFSAYYNPVLGGTKTALSLGIYENGGSYNFEAANFLNQNFPNSNVYVPNNYEAFASFYKFKSQRELDKSTNFIIATLDIDRKEFENFGCKEKVKDFGPYDFKVVAIFRCF